MLNKKKIRAQIATYEKRRKEYKQYLKNTTKKLESLKRSLKGVENNEKKINKLVKKTKDFFGEDVLTSVKKTMYRDMFCKFAVENEFSATEIGKTINKNRGTVLYRRRKCVEYFKEELNKALWQDYKKFMTT